MSGAQMEYDLGGFTQVIALEERRREALPDLPPSDLINIALQKYRCGCSPLRDLCQNTPCHSNTSARIRATPVLYHCPEATTAPESGMLVSA